MNKRYDPLNEVSKPVRETAPEPKEHVWVLGRSVGLHESSELYRKALCKHCGVLRRADGNNGRCRGVIKVSIR